MRIAPATFAVALALAASGLLVAPAPVAAAHAVPWRFSQTTSTAVVAPYVAKGWTLQCPAGYTPTSGGMLSYSTSSSSLTTLLAYPNPATGAFHIMVYNNWDATSVTVGATCVAVDDVGPITTVWGEFARNGSGRAGGNTVCPEGTTILSAGVDWAGTSVDRRIDFSSPADGNGRTWYVAGYSPTSGDKLGVELRCVDATYLTGEYVEASDSPSAGPAGTGNVTATCASGYRILTGGAAPAGTRSPGVDQGWVRQNGPLDHANWRTAGWEEAGVTIRAMAYCVPASTVSIGFTGTPAVLSNQTSGSITPVVTDSAGEQLVVQCYLDGQKRSCVPGSAWPYGPLLEGPHSFDVVASNQSGQSAYSGFNWTIDATVPTVATHTGATDAPIAGPLNVTFSENVTGVDGASVTVHAQSANKDVTGTVARPTPSTATWTPSAPLVPGETYRVFLGSAVTDAAGNALTATYFDVRAETIVDNGSVALDRRWDRDASTSASGGSYIAERLAGSRADLTVTGTAGQTVSLYGLRMPDGGYADIYLDGVKKTTVHFYASATSRVRVYLSPALTAGKHTISVRPLGTKPSASSAAWVRVDNALVGSTTLQETSFKQSFRTVTDASAYGGKYEQIVSMNASDTTPAQYRVTGVGTGVKIYATNGSTSGSARIYVDGVLKTTVNLNSPSTTYKALVYSGSFALGVHAIRVEAVGTTTSSNSAVNLDRITLT